MFAAGGRNNAWNQRILEIRGNEVIKVGQVGMKFTKGQCLGDMNGKALLCASKNNIRNCTAWDAENDYEVWCNFSLLTLYF